MTDNDKTGVLFVVIKTQFSGRHNYPGAPKEVEYLELIHRHMFYVTMKWKVTHDNRDKEFIMMKNKVNHFLRDNWENRYLGNRSCEMLAKRLANLFDADFVSVFEDNENGAEFLKC